MRTKSIIKGLKNSQKIRVMVNGFGMYMQVKDISNICITPAQVAVQTSLEKLGNEILEGKGTTGFGTSVDGISVQVDLV